MHSHSLSNDESHKKPSHEKDEDSSSESEDINAPEEKGGGIR